VAIVSNNSTALPEDFAEILFRCGAEVPAGRILLAGAEALARACETGGRRAMVLGDGRLKAHGRNRGLEIVREGADVVVLLRDTRFSYAKLERAANCLRGGARLIVANPDLTHPSLRDRVVPETGALLAALLACSGPGEVEAEVVGKPSPRLFDKACQALSVRPPEAVMIGDNPATDIAGAEAMGLQSLLVGAGSALSFAQLLGRPTPGALRSA
jgi:4-nitrophenyl phosphatase